MIKVYGDGLDAIVTVNALLKSGEKVNHYARKVNAGGHFRGAQCGERSFDLGMVLLEPNFDKSHTRDLLEYNGEFGRDSRVFLSHVFDWLEKELGELINHPVYTQVAPDKLIPDYFIGDNLDFLGLLNSEAKNELQKRITTFLRHSPVGSDLHPSKKFTTDLSAKTPLIEVLKQVYGPDIYRVFFEPFLVKLSGETKPSIPIRDNRRVWMPNYYPESLLYEINQSEKYAKFKLNPLTFLRPSNSQIAEFVVKLDQENQNNVNYRSIVSDKIFQECDYFDSNSIVFVNYTDFINSQNQQVKASKTILSPVKGEDYSISNTLSVTHFCVKECESRTVFVPEKNSQLIRYSLYRTINQSSISLESTIGVSSGNELTVDLMKNIGIEPLCRGNTREIPLRIKNTPFHLKEWKDFTCRVNDAYKNLNEGLFLIHPDSNNFNDSLLRGLVAIRRRVNK